MAPFDREADSSGRGWAYATALGLLVMALNSTLLLRKDLTGWDRHWLAQQPASFTAACTSPSVTERGARVFRPFTAIALPYLQVPALPSPASRQMANVLLHAVVVAFAFLVGRWVLSSTSLGAGAALLFAAHPAHAEVVARMDGCSELLAASGVLLSILLLAARCEANYGLMTTAAAAAGAIAVMANEAATALPLLWLVLAQPRAGAAPPHSGTRSVLRDPGFWGLLAVSAGALAARHSVTGSFGSPPGDYVENPLTAASLSERSVAAAAILGRYLVMLIWPFRLSPDYSYNTVPLVGSPDLPRALMAGAVLLALGVLAILARRRRPVYLSCWLFTLVALGPSLNLLFPVDSAISERFLYLPSLGFFWGMMELFNDVGWVSRFEVHFRRPTSKIVKPLTLILVCLVLPWGTGTFVRNREWRTERGLLQAAVRRMPDNARLQVALGHSQVGDGDYLAAERHFDRALDIRPGYRAALLGLEETWRRMGRNSEADQLKRTLEAGAAQR
jgi:protein O-mannosyl-transferase